MPVRTKPAIAATPRAATGPYKFKTEPRLHQRRAWEMARECSAFALLMEMGTGKSKVEIDSSAWSKERGLIDSWIVLAPSGVHMNWVRQELPKHLPERLKAKWIGWDSGKARSKKFLKELEAVYASPFPIVAMNIEAILTEPGLEVLRRLGRGSRCKLTIDESSLIKSVKAARTKLLIKGAPLFKQRRILNGTPITNGPLNLYSQFAFLDPKILGFRSYYAFSHRYAEWKAQRNWAQGRDYEELIGYQNLDELIAKIEPHSYRVLKKDCLDLPPKVYAPPRYFELSKEQARLYVDLRDEFVAELDGNLITANLALTRLLRLQQVTCGYLPAEGALVPVPGKDPRMEALLEVLEEAAPKKAIIWCRFQEDIKRVRAALTGVYGGDSAVTYDGNTSADMREYALTSFQSKSSPVRFFVGNPAAGGRGLDLYAAEMVIYFSNSFSLEQRQQSEDRAHRHGLTHSVTYVDLVAQGTVDEQIIEALRSGQELASGILSKLRSWEL